MFITGWVLFIMVVLWVVPSTAALVRKQLRIHRSSIPGKFPELISVIVPARNEGENIEKALTSLLASEQVQI